jgi:hypothetical protein
MTRVLSPHTVAGALIRRGCLVFPVWWIIETLNGQRRCACPRGARCESPGKHLAEEATRPPWACCVRSIRRRAQVIDQEIAR